MPRSSRARPITTTGTGACWISAISRSSVRSGLTIMPSTKPLFRLRTSSVVDVAVSPVLITTTR